MKPGGTKTRRTRQVGWQRAGRQVVAAPRAVALVAFAALVSVATASVAAVTDDLPVLGDSSSAIVSPTQERRIGEAFLRSLNAQAPVSSDPPLKYFTENLMYELGQHADLTDHRLHIVVINDARLNAFAAPGGVIGINLGLFLHAESVHEFVAVAAHELAHLSQRHFARDVEYRQQASIPNMVGLLTSIALMATVGGDVGLAALQGSQALALDKRLRYSRAREQEADRLGIDTMVAADFDPHAMASMFGRMARAARFDQRPPAFLLTHPVTESRITDARNQAAAIPKELIADRLEYQMMQTRARIITAETPTAAVQIFRAEHASGGKLLKHASRYGLAAALSTAGRSEEALAALAPLRAALPENLHVQLLVGEILLESNKAGAAIKYLAERLADTPGNIALSMYYAKALRQGERAGESQRVLEQLARQRPTDPDVFYELAETAGLAGDIVAVHRARAEYFQLHGDFGRAIQHLEYALKELGNKDFQLNARIWQRSLDLKDLANQEF